MISPISAPVLATSALVSTPALWSVWRGTLPLDVGLSRFVVVQLACWLALSAGAALLTGPNQAHPATGEDEHHLAPSDCRRAAAVAHDVP